MSFLCLLGRRVVETHSTLTSAIFSLQKDIVGQVKQNPVEAAMSALAQQTYNPSLLLFHSTRLQPISPLPHFNLLSKPLKKPSFFLHSTPPSHSASSSSPSNSIFLSLLNQPRHQDQEDANPDEDDEGDAGKKEEDVEEELTDPLLKFFKSCNSATVTTTPDPPNPGKFSLKKKNRRSSWHLAPNFESDITAQTAELGSSGSSDSRTLWEGVVGEILKIARGLPKNVTIGESLCGFEGRVSERECVEVLQLMGEEEEEKGRMVRCCLYFYEWMRLQEPSLVTPRTCTVLFPVLGKAGMASEIMVLFRNLPSTKEFRDAHVYNAAISGLLSCGRYDDAYKVHAVMESDNVSPDHVTCSIMITTMRKSGRSAKEAWELFERMNRKGVKWSQEIMGSLVKSFCDEGLKNEALIVVTEMQRKGISPNTIVYNTLMDAYSKSNKIEEAEGLFAEMKSKGLKPTSATFNILMDAYSRRMQPEIVEKLLLEMQEARLQPNAKSYTCLVSAYGRQRKMSDMAADAFLRMKKAGIRPTSHSYTALIHAYSVSLWHEKAYTAFESMLREGIKPSIETYTTLLDAFRRAGDTQTLMSIWKMMMREKVEGTQVTFNILLDGFSKQGRYAEARDVISEFGKLCFHPTVMTYNMLMNAYARGGQDSKLPQLLKEMAALNLKPDSITYMTMIYAYVRARDFKRAFFYHKMMVKTGQVPDVRSYEKLRAILEAKAKIKNRRDKSAILGIINSKMGMLKVKTKTKKDEFWKNKTKRRKNNNFASDGR